MNPEPLHMIPVRLFPPSPALEKGGCSAATGFGCKGQMGGPSPGHLQARHF